MTVPLTWIPLPLLFQTFVFCTVHVPEPTIALVLFENSESIMDTLAALIPSSLFSKVQFATLTFEPDTPTPFLRNAQAEIALDEFVGNSIPSVEYSTMVHSTSAMRPPVRILMFPQSPAAGEEALLVNVIMPEGLPSATRVPSTIMPVPFPNLTVTPGSIVKKTSARMTMFSDTTYGLPDNVHVVFIVIGPPTSVPKRSSAVTNRESMSSPKK